MMVDQNTVIGVKEPIYPNGPNSTYVNGGTPLTNYAVWARPTLNNSRMFMKFSQYFGYFNDIPQYGPYSIYKGPFDIVPKPMVQLSTNTGTVFNENWMLEIFPGVDPTNQLNGATQYTVLPLPAPGDNSDTFYRLTQCYYVGCYTNTWANNSGFRSFMTDCSAGTFNPTQQGLFDNPIKWPKVAPNKGLLVENFHTDISAGVPFIVDVNFVLEIKSTQNEISATDDFALYGQINYHTNFDTTQTMPYFDWSNNNVPECMVQPTTGLSNPGGGGAPMNILYKDISSSPVLFRPQYSGDLLYKYSSQSPLSTPPILAFSAAPGADLSGAVYNIPIHWRAKCIIPQPSTMTSGINWNGFGDSKFDPTEKSKIYLALNLFNTTPEFGLNLRTFQYNIKLKEVNLSNTAPTIVGYVPPGGNTNPQWGYSAWQSADGFKANMTILPLN